MKSNKDNKGLNNHIDSTSDLSNTKEKKTWKQKWKSFLRSRLLDRVLTICMYALAGVIVYQLYTLGMYGYDYWQSESDAKLAQQLMETYVEPTPTQAEPTPIPIETPTPIPTETPLQTELTSPMALQTPEPTKKPEPPAPVNTQPPNIDALKKQFKNDDIVGYLIIPGTKINYPVVQGQDNVFYLSNGITKKHNVNGVIFMDAENSGDFSDPNTVLYGHNMKNGTMFNNLRLFLGQQFYEKHPTFTFITSDGPVKYEIFAAYQTTTDFNYIATKFVNKKQFATFIEQIRANSAITSPLSVTENDFILTLSTCTTTAPNLRYAVHAKRIDTQE